MSEVTTEEGWHTVADGTKLYTKIWKPASPAKAKVVFVHGFSDHCNTYGTLFPTLASHGIETLAFDQRGWGRSVRTPRDRGATGPTSLVLSDITSVLTSALPSPVPLFLMGHSMGGAEVLTYAALGPSETRRHIRGYLAEAPFIALHPATRPYKATVVVGRLAARVVPWFQMENKLRAELLSRDPEVCRRFVEDELCHDLGTLEGLAGMLDRAGDLERGAVVVRDGDGVGEATRVWVSHGTADGVCEFGATKKWFDRLDIRDKELKVYEGWYHQLHSEPGEDKIRFANDVAGWILARCDGLGGMSDGPPTRPKL